MKPLIYLNATNLNEIQSSLLIKFFCQIFGESSKCHRNMPCGQTDELKWRHILKGICERD